MDCGERQLFNLLKVTETYTGKSYGKTKAYTKGRVKRMTLRGRIRNKEIQMIHMKQKKVKMTQFCSFQDLENVDAIEWR